jgi:hypothetical protein
VEIASVDPMAAAMASAQDNPAVSLEGHGSDDLFEEPDAEPAPVVQTEAHPTRDEPSPPVFIKSESLPPAPIPPSEPEPQPAQPPKPASATPNPFSVEEIEAEFARLLGRPLDRKN